MNDRNLPTLLYLFLFFIHSPLLANTKPEIIDITDSFDQPQSLIISTLFIGKGIDVKLKKGTRVTVEVEAHEEDLEHLQIAYQHQSMKISRKKNRKSPTKKSAPISLIITTPHVKSLRHIIVGENASLDIHLFEERYRLSIELQKKSQLTGFLSLELLNLVLKKEARAHIKVNAQAINAKATQKSILDLDLTADHATFHANSKSIITGKIQVQEIHLKASRESLIELVIKAQEVTAKASSSSKIFFYGNLKNIDCDQDPSSSIRFRFLKGV